MFPIHIIGIALAGSLLFAKQSGKPGKPMGNSPNKPFPPMGAKGYKTPYPINPFESFFKGINRQLTGTKRNQPQENFEEIAKKFIPPEGVLLTPKYPLNSKSVGSADLDGDSQNELILSFRSDNEIKTIVLKKENDNWYKAAETGNAGHENVNYREFVDLTGEGRKQLVIAFSSQGRDAELHGYSLEENNLNELFALNYNRLQVLKVPTNDRNKPDVNLAIWKKEDSGAYNVDLLKWNGTELESINDTGKYYSSNVVPYFLRKVKREPDTPQNWYNLADSLIKAGQMRDAQTAIGVGMSYDLSPELRDSFTALKDRIEKA